MSEYCHHNNTASHCMECIAEQLGSRKAPKPRPQVPTDKQATDAATIQSFVAGLMFDDEMQRVVLIRKDRPAWQRGLLNGVGGKMEDGEGSIDTMLREFKEEAGVQTTRSEWSYFMQLRGDQFYVDFFFGRSTEHFEAAHTTESEKLVKLEQIVSGELIVDGDYVYFTSQWGNLVLRVPKTGGMVTLLAEAPAPLGLASDATHIYFLTFSTDPENGTLQRVLKTGGQPEVLLRGHPGMDQLVVDEQAVYFRSNRGLWKIGKSGGPAEQLLANGEHKNLGRLAGDAGYLYFFYESKTQGRYEVARLPKAGGAPEVIGPIAVSTGRLALSDSYVYFFREASLTENLLVKVPKAGGPPETVDGTGYSTGYLSVSGGDVYFTDIAAVYRVPK